MTTTHFCGRQARLRGATMFCVATAFSFFVSGLDLTAGEAAGPAARDASGHVCASCQTSHHVAGIGGHAPRHPCVRAGDPHRIAWYAKPSRNKRDTFGYVGGNAAARRGEPRLPDEGTWGLDYGGLLSRHHTWLNWLHGRPSRQAGGSYTTDGPHLLEH